MTTMAHGTRIIKPLTYELRQQVTIYIEEGLLTQALDFLTTLLTSGVASNGTIHLPPPSHLALICTLSAHPNFTNRSKDPSTAKVSLLAHRYLNLVNEIVSPTQAQILEAYSWPELTLTRRGGFSRRHDEGSQEPEADFNSIRSPYARDRSLFSKASDFWAVVGWAFRCSVLYPTTRWPAWELWLTYMISTLERELNDRIMPDDQAESLIAKYVQGPERRTRILRAIFADSSDRFANEFPELWKNEARVRVEKKREVGRVKKIDVENEEFGDYLDVSTDDEKEEMGEEHDGGEVLTDAWRKRMAEREEADATALLGGQVAVGLRMRLLGLLGRLAEALPIHFGDIWTLFDACQAYLKPLPLPAFSVLISPQMLDSFSEEAALGLVKYIALSLIQTGAKASREKGLSQEAFVEGWLPCTANTNIYVDNAKLSICFEVLMRMLWDRRKLKYDADLEMAVERGIEKRSAKATSAKGKKGEASGERDLDSDKTALQNSAMRLRMLVHMSKVASERSA